MLGVNPPKRIRRSRVPKHEAILGHLRQQILSGALKPGDTIPSYRELMVAYDATANTVRQAMMTLQTAGLVESVPGIGCVVTKRAVQRHTVGVAMLGHPESNAMSQFLVNQLTLLHDQFDELHCDLSLRFIPVITDETLAALVTWAKRWDGILVTGVVPARVIQTVADSGVPVVLLGESCDQKCPPGISNVTVDVRNTIQLAVSHLVSLGHRRILLCSCQGTRYFDMVTQGFRSAMTECGCGAEANEWFFERDNSDSCLQLPAWLAGLAQPPTAIIVEEGTRATLVMRVLEANGWAVPERLSVLAITPAAHQPRSLEGLTCVVNSVREIILRAANVLLENIRSSGQTARAEKITAIFVPGDTCRPLDSQERSD